MVFTTTLRIKTTISKICDSFDISQNLSLLSTMNDYRFKFNGETEKDRAVEIGINGDIFVFVLLVEIILELSDELSSSKEINSNSSTRCN